MRARYPALAVDGGVHDPRVLATGVQRRDRLLYAPGTPGPLPEGVPAAGAPGAIPVVVVVHHVVAAVVVEAFG